MVKTFTWIKPGKLRSPIKHHGGKSYLARRILKLMPYHETYVEPYIGGGSIILNKKRAKVEVINDLNEQLMWFWRVVADPERYGHFFNQVARTKYEEVAGEIAFKASKAWLRDTIEDIGIEAVDKVQLASHYMRKSRMSRGGLGNEFAWSERLRGKKQPGGAIPGDANGWRTALAELNRVHSRLQGILMFNGNAVDVIKRYDDKSTLFYLDPPYPTKTRNHQKAYDFEMDDSQHAGLLGEILACKGMVAISSYRSDLYDTMLKDWRRVDIKMPNHSGQGKVKNKRIESLWMNYGVF